MKYLAEPFVHCAAFVFVFVVGISDLRQDLIVLFMALGNYVFQLVLLVSRDRR